MGGCIILNVAGFSFGRRVSCKSRLSYLFSALAAERVARFALKPSMVHCKILKKGDEENYAVLSIAVD